MANAVAMDRGSGRSPSSNEAQSATLAARVLHDISVLETVVEMVVRLIRATQHHAVAADPDTRLLVDIELAILGQPAPIFDTYEQQRRQEYAWVSHEAFREGRTKILRAFLSRATIYTTDSFRQRYEGQARINMAQSLKVLENSTPTLSGWGCFVSCLAGFAPSVSGLLPSTVSSADRAPTPPHHS
jgi:predicted metal-dependent HD superfamily phosphohydrolase